MKFCPDCGTELPDAAKFCFSCGQQLADDIPPAADLPSEPPPSSGLPAAAPPPFSEPPVPQRPVPQRPVPQRPAEHPGRPDDDLPEIASPPPPVPPPGFEPPLPPPPGDDVWISTEPPHAPADDADEPLTPPPPRPVYGAYARGEPQRTSFGDDEPPEFPTEPPYDLPPTPPPTPVPPPDLPLRLSLSDEPTTRFPDEPRDFEVDPTHTYVAIEERVRPADGPLIAGRNWFASHKLLTALAAAAVIAIVVFAILSADPTDPQGTGTVTTPGVTVPATATPQVTVPPSPTAAGGVASPGASPATSTATSPGVFRDGNIEFAVTNTECGNETINDPGGGEPARADGQFCYVAVRAKNMGTTSRTLRLADQKIFASDNKEYPADSEAWSRLPANDKQLFSEIRAGSEAEGTIIFDIPKGTRPTRVELHESQSSGGSSIPIG